MNVLRWIVIPLRYLCRMSVFGNRRGTLVVQPLQGIGDMVWHLPHVHAIAAQCADGAVTVLTKPRSQADKIFAADRTVRNILWLERNPGRHDGLTGLLRLVRQLRKQRFAEAWLLHGSSRYALALMLAGIPVTHGYGRGLQAALLSDTRFLPKAQCRSHPLQMGALMLALQGIPVTPEMGRLSVSPAARDLVTGRFGGNPRPWIGFGIGSSEPVKQWGAERFGGLAALMLREISGTIFLIGGSAEAAMAETIKALAAVPGRVVNATDLRLDQTAALLAQCSLYVGNDTGALNIAAAAGTRAIGLFGGSQPLTYSEQICPVSPAEGAGDTTGMAAITIEQVLAATVRIGLTA